MGNLLEAFGYYYYCYYYNCYYSEKIDNKRSNTSLEVYPNLKYKNIRTNRNNNYYSNSSTMGQIFSRRNKNNDKPYLCGCYCPKKQSTVTEQPASNQSFFWSLECCGNRSKYKEANGPIKNNGNNNNNV